MRPFGLAAAAVAAFFAATPVAADEVLVFAAASLKEAMDEIAAGFEETTGHTAVVSLAGSSALARQISQGAPADVFISANPDWMDWLEEAGWIRSDTRSDLVANRLVLVAQGGQPGPVEIGPDFDVPARLGDGWLAMALTDAVPAGIYGKAALEWLGLWEALRPQVAQAENVRAALALVALGEARLGIVYASDALAEPKVGVVGVFPAASHPPIVYPVALTRDAGEPVAAEFLDYLNTPAARASFEKHGFLEPE